MNSAFVRISICRRTIIPIEAHSPQISRFWFSLNLNERDRAENFYSILYQTEYYMLPIQLQKYDYNPNLV